MIRSFKDKRTETLFGGGTVKEFAGFRKAAERKLTMLDSASDLRDLRAPQANRLEKLKGNRAGQYSVRINDQWRICFVWKQDGPRDVEIVDYHWMRSVMVKNGMRPVHPGEILLEEFLKPSEGSMNPHALAKAIGVPANRITAIIKGQRGITGDTAVRLGAFFNTSAEFWMNLQKTYELRLAEKALPVKVRKQIEEQRHALVRA
jgi:addiction module HigA family antidote